MAVRNPTKWTPQSGSGFVLSQPNYNLVANSGKTIITNSLKNIITNGVRVVGKYATAWTATGA